MGLNRKIIDAYDRLAEELEVRGLLEASCLCDEITQLLNMYSSDFSHSDLKSAAFLSENYGVDVEDALYVVLGLKNLVDE